MDYIRKLPLLMSLTVGFIVGTVGYTQKVPNKENMLKMLIVMIGFYISGYLIRDTVLDIMESIKKKNKKKLEQLKQAELKEEEIRRKAEKREDKGNFLDLNTGYTPGFDTDEEGFDALPVADFIKKELNQ